MRGGGPGIPVDVGDVAAASKGYQKIKVCPDSQGLRTCWYNLAKICESLGAHRLRLQDGRIHTEYAFRLSATLPGSFPYTVRS